MPQDWLGYLVFGAVLGLSAGLSPGPLMMVLLRESLATSAAAGIRVACAPMITDGPIVLLSIFVLRELSGQDLVLAGISLAGAVFLVRIALESLRTNGLPSEADALSAGSSLWRGVLANFLSPHPYLFWMTVGAPLVLRPETGTYAEPVSFLAGFYVCLIGAKISVAAIVGRFRHVVGGRGYRWIMRLLGLALLIMGALFLVDAATYVLN